MASELEPCGACHRHVRASETACPFCDQPREPSASFVELRLLNAWDRGRMIALGAVLSAAGIALGCRDPSVAVYGGPPPPLPTTTPSATPSPSAAPEASATAIPSASSIAPPAPAPEQTATRRQPAPVYGAPPPPFSAPKPTESK